MGASGSRLCLWGALRRVHQLRPRPPPPRFPIRSDPYVHWLSGFPISLPWWSFVLGLAFSS
ncbi:MAG: hypothetical protein ACRD21_24725, partial [Vicinamibacteria bacterium]